MNIPNPGEITDLLRDCKQKLQMYREQHSGEYVGGSEYTSLVRRLDTMIALIEEIRASCLQGQRRRS